VQNSEPFDAASFATAYGSAATAAKLRKTVYHAACEIIRAPTEETWAFLKSHLQPLDVVWADALPTRMLLAAYGDDLGFDEVIAARAAAPRRDLAGVFGEAQAAALAAADRAGSPRSRMRRKMSFGGSPKRSGRVAVDPARLAARHDWTPWEGFRLAALWAMRETKAEMGRRCAAFLALEPYGSRLRSERDVRASVEQPLLRLKEVAAVTDLVAPEGAARLDFLADVDRLCFPELLKALSTAAFDELEAHFRELLPGIRTFVHGGGADDRETPPPPPRDRPEFSPREDNAKRASFWANWRGAPPAADDAELLESGGVALAETKRGDDDAVVDPEACPVAADGVVVDVDSWPTRCLLKCAPAVSIKRTTRMAAKVDEYEREKGPGRYPYAAFIGDSLRASVVCDDAEAFWKAYEALRGDPDDAKQRFKVLRLKNKLGGGQEPFDYHLNCSFQPSTFKAPIQVEVQIWAASIMDLNDVSHWQYEVARAENVTDF